MALVGHFSIHRLHKVHSSSLSFTTIIKFLSLTKMSTGQTSRHIEQSDRHVTGSINSETKSPITLGVMVELARLFGRARPCNYNC